MKTWRVCVVDDDVDAALVLVNKLIANNYDACAVHSGDEALALCREESFDLILLDVVMPGMDGFEVCRQLKSDPKTLNIPVVFVTVRDSQEDVRRGYDAGAIAYVTKPYHLPYVMVTIEAALLKKRVSEHMRAEPEPIFDSANTDHLTGLRTSRFLMQRLQEEVEKAHRYNHPVACLVLDVDEIHAVDPDLGAASLDDLLVEIGMLLRNASRGYDILARYDGAIFSVVLPNTPLKEAMKYACKIRREIDSTTFSDPSFPTYAGVSIGVVACRNGKAESAEQVLGEAMRNLLRAKNAVGDRVVAVDMNA